MTVQDIAGLYMLAVTNSSLEGVFNQTAPEPATNRQLVHVLARQFNRSLWMPATPGFVLKMLMGERSSFVLGSINAPPSALLQQKYTYAYPTIESALDHIYGQLEALPSPKQAGELPAHNRLYAS